MIYFISNNGVQKGPLTFEQLKGQKINKDTLVWKEGAPDWVKASEVEELVPILELMPPSVDTVSAVTANVEMASQVRNGERKVEVCNNAPNCEVEMLAKAPEVEKENIQKKLIDNTMTFSHFLTFKGRCRRTEYFMVSVLCYAIIGACAGMSLDDTVFSVLLLLLISYVYISTAVRRCHDRGHSGFYILIPYYCLYLLFADSKPGDNKYGNNPKGIYFKGQC